LSERKWLFTFLMFVFKHIIFFLRRIELFWLHYFYNYNQDWNFIIYSSCIFSVWQNIFLNYFGNNKSFVGRYNFSSSVLPAVTCCSLFFNFFVFFFLFIKREFPWANGKWSRFCFFAFWNFVIQRLSTLPLLFFWWVFMHFEAKADSLFHFLPLWMRVFHSLVLSSKLFAKNCCCFQAFSLVYSIVNLALSLELWNSWAHPSHRNDKLRG